MQIRPHTQVKHIIANNVSYLLYGLKSTIASIGLVHIIDQHIMPNIANITSPMFHHNLIHDFFQEFSLL